MRRHRPVHLVVLVVALSAAVVCGVIRAFAEEPPDPRVIDITARRYEFVPSQIEATVGEPVRLVVHSDDGVHGVQIKKFKVNKDVPDGNRPVVINFTPNAEGEFEILCSEYCGEGHNDMRGTLVVRAHPTPTP